VKRSDYLTIASGTASHISPVSSAGQKSRGFPVASSTAHILLNGRTIADVAGATASAVLTYVYGDNLGSAEATADANNRVQGITDHTLFGAINNHE
jgi:hypothetical protein